jgi:type IV secretion system protein VirB1
MIHAALLAALLQHCAPQTDVRTLAAIVAVESSGDSWAIRDPIANRAVHPRSYDEAVATAGRLLSRGARVSVGLSQVLLPRNGLSASTLLGSPCANLRAGANILADAYGEQLRLVRAPATEEGQQLALRRALSVYNSGTATGAPAYTARVLAALSSPLVEQITAIAAGEVRRPVAAESLPIAAAVPPEHHDSSLFYSEKPR